jgi:hypothetical protein
MGACVAPRGECCQPPASTGTIAAREAPEPRSGAPPAGLYADRVRAELAGGSFPATPTLANGTMESS